MAENFTPLEYDGGRAPRYNTRGTFQAGLRIGDVEHASMLANSLAMATAGFNPANPANPRRPVVAAGRVFRR